MSLACYAGLVGVVASALTLLGLWILARQE